jgi:hypothetical protein
MNFLDDNLDQEGWIATDLEASEESENEAIDNKAILPFDPKLIKITVETNYCLWSCTTLIV